METIELTLPSWMASALINGDITGLEDDKEAKVNDLLEYCTDNSIGSCVDVSDEENFTNRPSFDSVNIYGETLGGNFSTYTFLPLNH